MSELIKKSYPHYGVPERKDKEKWIENLFEEIMTINYSNLGTHMDLQDKKLKCIQTD